MSWWAVALAIAVVLWLVTVLWLAGARRQVPRLDAQLSHERALRRGAEDRVESLETINSSFIDQAPAAMLLVRPDRSVSFFNRAAAELLHLDASAVGWRLIDLIPDDDLNRMVRQALEGGLPESIELSPPGSHLVLLAGARPIATEHGYLHGAAVILENLTEVRRLEVARRDLMANVSHELRTPLAGMKALVETLEGGAIEDPATAANFLAKIHSELDRLAFLVRDVLELSRIESGSVQLALQAVSLGAVFDQAAERVQADVARGELALLVEGGPPLRAIADPRRCEQVLVNLLQNAVRFTAPGGQITASWEVCGKETVVHVRDTGIGISDDDLPRIFERFYKVDKARAHGEGSGTGLGLAIVKHLVTGMGGRVGVSSQLGVGSDFWFALPLAGVVGDRMADQP